MIKKKNYDKYLLRTCKKLFRNNWFSIFKTSKIYAKKEKMEKKKVIYDEILPYKKTGKVKGKYR